MNPIWREAMHESLDKGDAVVDRLEKRIDEIQPNAAAAIKKMNYLKKTLAFYHTYHDAKRTNLPELHERLLADPDDFQTILVYEVKVQLVAGELTDTSNPDRILPLLTEEKEFLTSLRSQTDDEDVERIITSLLDGTIPLLTKEGKRAVKQQSLVGDRAPKMSADIDAWVNGSPRTREQMRGKVVLLDFWAVWCGPCIAAFPKLEALHNEYSDRGLMVIGMTGYYNYRWDAEASAPTESDEPVSRQVEQVVIEKVAKRHGLTVPIAIEKNRELTDAFRVHAVPHLVLIDRRGIIRWVAVDIRGKEDALREHIESLLAEPGTDVSD